MNEKRLIVNADDFGMSRGITDAIVIAHRYGIVTSTSLMANMPAAEYAASRVAKTPAMGIGVHLNICTGRPILSPRRRFPPWWMPRSHFHPPAIMIRKLWTWRAVGREIETEFRAQIQWMKDRGTVPTPHDSHHHMNIYPAAVGPFLRAIAAEGVRCARAPVSSVWPKTRQMGGPHEGLLLRRVAVQVYRHALQVIPFRRLDMPQSRVSFLSRDRHNLAALGECWKAAIASLPAGTFELACHPGLFERGFSETDRIHAQREQELQWLTDPDCRDAIDRNGIRLITYRDLSSRAVLQPMADEVTVLQ